MPRGLTAYISDPDRKILYQISLALLLVLLYHEIHSLETELKTRLFERIGREVSLTETGKRLQVYAEQILKLAEETKISIEPHPTLIR